ncbi:hypothetical protein HYALB_00013678 [Hymenoscyphus albidus]|uniref:Uncharacterized protein n=1 Tax=Hymenoscyphus albidus TaxID=595503 RepID=A0A9N9Q9R9_9HELO|nr:hypothetical protein HYALB_00013678 [Hymenoscyphus albidus]
MEGNSSANMVQTHIFSPLNNTDINACRRLLRGIHYRLVSYYFDPAHPDEAALSFQESAIVTTIMTSICANPEEGLLLHAILALVEQERREPEKDDRLLLMMRYVGDLAPEDHLLYPRAYIGEFEKARKNYWGPEGLGRVFRFRREDLALLAPAALFPLSKYNTLINGRKVVGAASVVAKLPANQEEAIQSIEKDEAVSEKTSLYFKNTNLDDMARKYQTSPANSSQHPVSKLARKSPSSDSLSSLSSTSDPFLAGTWIHEIPHTQAREYKESENDADSEYNSDFSFPTPDSSIAEEEFHYERMSDVDLDAYYAREIQRQNRESPGSVPIPCPYNSPELGYGMIFVPCNTPESGFLSAEAEGEEGIHA